MKAGQYRGRKAGGGLLPVKFCVGEDILGTV